MTFRKGDLKYEGMVFPGEKAEKQVMEAQGVSVIYYRPSSGKDLQGNIISQLGKYLGDRSAEGDSNPKLHGKYVIN